MTYLAQTRMTFFDDSEKSDNSPLSMPAAKEGRDGLTLSTNWWESRLLSQSTATRHFVSQLRVTTRVSHTRSGCLLPWGKLKTKTIFTIFSECRKNGNFWNTSIRTSAFLQWIFFIVKNMERKNGREKWRDKKKPPHMALFEFKVRDRKLLRCTYMKNMCFLMTTMWWRSKTQPATRAPRNARQRENSNNVSDKGSKKDDDDDFVTEVTV